MLVELSKLWPCVFYFGSVKFHYVKETHEINSLLTLVKIVLASQDNKATKQIFVKICWQLKTPTRTWKCTRCTMQMSYSYLPFKNFSKLAKQAETIRNSAKKDFGYDYSLGNSEINSIPEWRVSLLNKPKSLPLTTYASRYYSFKSLK